MGVAVQWAEGTDWTAWDPLMCWARNVLSLICRVCDSYCTLATGPLKSMTQGKGLETETAGLKGQQSTIVPSCEMDMIFLFPPTLQRF